MLGQWVGNAIPDMSRGLPKIDGSYRLLQILGEGGMGIVFLAEDLRVGSRHVALKVIDLRDDDAQDGYMDMVRSRLDSEIKTLGALTGIPGIVTVFGAEVDELREIALVSMQLVKGVSFQGYIWSGGRRRLVTPETLPWFLKRSAEAIAAADRMHDRGVVHRDLKPGNLMLAQDRDEEERSMIIDFGISLRFDHGGGLASARHTKANEVAGTPAYMSPEQHTRLNPADPADGGTNFVVDHRSDQFSLGMIIFEILSGGYLARVEHLGQDTKLDTLDLYRALIATYAARKEPDFNVFPEWLRNHQAFRILQPALQRALSVDRNKRFHDCRDFAAALYEAAGTPLTGLGFGASERTLAYEFGQPRATPPTTPPPPPPGDGPDPSGPPSLAGMSSKSGMKIPFLADPERRRVVMAVMVGLGLAMITAAVLYPYVKPQQATRDATTLPQPTPVALDGGSTDAQVSPQTEDASVPVQAEPDATPTAPEPPVVVQPSNPNPRPNGQNAGQQRRSGCERLTDPTARENCEADRAEDRGRRNCCEGSGMATWTSRGGEQYSCGSAMSATDRAELNCDGSGRHRKRH